MIKVKGLSRSKAKCLEFGKACDALEQARAWNLALSGGDSPRRKGTHHDWAVTTT